MGQSGWYSRDIARHQGTEHPKVKKMSALQWKLCTLLSRQCKQCALTALHGNAMQWGRQTERDMSDGFNLGLGRASSLLQDLPLFLFYSKGLQLCLLDSSWSDRISLNSPLENL